MNDLTDKYINQDEVNANLAFLLNEWNKWRILALQGGTRCFTGDTLVLTVTGYKAISDIKIGEYVYSVSENICGLKKVINKYSYEGVQHKHNLTTFVFDNYKIQCTYDHKFRINGKWIKAIDIANGRMEDIKQPVCDIDIRKISDIREICCKDKQEAGNDAPCVRCNRISKNINERKDSQSTQGCSGGIYSESGTEENSQPSKWHKVRQSSRKFRVGNAPRELRPCSKKWICSKSKRGGKWFLQDNRENSKGDKSRAKYSTKRISRKIWGYNIANQRYPAFKDLVLSEIKDIHKSEYNGIVYDLEVEDFHTYLVTENNIVSHNSGKTYSIVDFIISIIEEYRGLIISVVRATLPSLKTSILRDFKEEMMALNLWSDANFNKTELEYKYKGNLIEFFSVDDEQKIRGRKRHILIVNEANEIHHDKMMQLLLRTEGIVIMDYNPSMVESYIYDDILERPDCAMIVTTYKDNPYLSKEIINEIERLKETDEQLWRIYGCGLKGEDRAGIVYSRWVKGDDFPTDLPTWYGIDFGFSNDPSGIVRVSFNQKDRTIYLTEIAYQKELINSDIARIIKQDIWEKETFIYKDDNWDIKIKNSNIIFNEKVLSLRDYIDNPIILRHECMDISGNVNETLYDYITKEIKKVANYLFEVYCDSAEPKSIHELRLHGISAYPCLKGSGSIGSQIFFMYNFRVLYKGENIERERRAYKWKEKKSDDREFDNVPIDANNHILDAARYACYTHLTKYGYGTI